MPLRAAHDPQQQLQTLHNNPYNPIQVSQPYDPIQSQPYNPSRAPARGTASHAPAQHGAYHDFDEVVDDASVDGRGGFTCSPRGSHSSTCLRASSQLC